MLVVAGAVAVVSLTVAGVIPAMAAWLAASVFAALPSVAWFVFGVIQQKYVVDFAGDAARYLEPRPSNVQVRQAIREDGLSLLDALHDDWQRPSDHRVRP